jgi:hypothetical protein
MLDRPTRKIAIILEREEVGGRWESQRWQLLGVVPDVGGEARVIHEDAKSLKRLHPGFDVTLFRDEAEGYYLNMSSEVPSVFVSIRMDEGSSEPYPFQATLSYNEAARWMDGGMQVERVPAYAELIVWMGEYVEQNYRPEIKKKRIRPKSFESKEGRYKSGM